MSADLSFMDLLFDKEDPLINFDKDIKSDDLKYKTISNDDWASTDDFLDSLLELENADHPFELLQNEELLDEQVLRSESVVESSSCSDSGVSSDQPLSPMEEDVEVEECVSSEESVLVKDESIIVDEENVIKEEVVELDQSMLQVLGINGVTTTHSGSKQVINVSTPGSPKIHQPMVRVKPVATAIPRRVIRVTPLPSNNPRSILIPVKSASGVTGVRTIKIISATGKSFTNQSGLNVRAKQLLGRATPLIKAEDEKTSGGETSDEQDSIYPRLQLTAEEKRLMAKEGVTLPTHYPLTKQEERELKRIRRKIRNKISAQDSRKRKKEYVDGLEDRVKQCTEENLSLMKKLKVLQTQNQSLSNQLRKLQQAVARSTAQTAQPATCLMVLVLSLALIMAPNLRNSRAATQRDLEIPDQKNTPLAGRSRSLLFSKPTDNIAEGALDQTAGGDVDGSKIIFDLEELLQFNKITPKRQQMDHDYSSQNENKKRERTAFVPHIDDRWPPPKRRYINIIDDNDEFLEVKLNKSRIPPPINKKVILQLPSEEEVQ